MPEQKAPAPPPPPESLEKRVERLEEFAFELATAVTLAGLAFAAGKFVH
jgi:hypothetical protein